jgi:hypothetical protein
MIEPTGKDIGRRVIYTGNRFPGGELEYGVITSFNPTIIFVRYGSNYGSKGTDRKDLEWNDEMKFTIGQRVVKQGEDSRFNGEIVACFVKRNLKTVRYVVENDDGILHIASERQLQLECETKSKKEE